MTNKTIYRAFAAAFLVSMASGFCAKAADQARTIINSLDPKSMNQLFEVSRTQPDAALTNIAPVSPNTFRFLFIWPASNPIMTYERVGQSFAERFAGFAEQMKPLATGFCLPSLSMYFGTAPYGGQDVNVAYRDIEVRYSFGVHLPCPGRLVSVAEIEQNFTATQRPGYGVPAPAGPSLPSQAPANPEDGLRPFLNTKPAAPLE